MKQYLRGTLEYLVAPVAAWGAFAVACVKFGAAFVVHAIRSRISGNKP